MGCFGKFFGFGELQTIYGAAGEEGYQKQDNRLMIIV